MKFSNSRGGVDPPDRCLQFTAPRHRAPVISDRFLEHDSEVSGLRRPPQSPGLSPTQQFWVVVEILIMTRCRHVNMEQNGMVPAPC